jgi:hypothetical protein
MHDVPLPGIKAESLLGFMAAIGTLRTAQACFPDVSLKLSWCLDGASWSPVLHSPAETIAALVSVVDPWLRQRHGSPAITFASDLKVPLDRFGAASSNAAESFLCADAPWDAAMLAAFGCSTIQNRYGDLEDTAFRTMSGAGHQHFLSFMNTLARETTAAHLVEALAGPWRYADPSPTMRWDCLDDRRYALRWDEPSTDPVRTVRGANRLAIEALPFFPVIPTAPNVATTTAFTGRRSHDTFVSWPVWTGQISCDVVASLLANSVIVVPTPPAELLTQLGIVAIFRSQRITMGQYRNFTPAACI